MANRNKITIAERLRVKSSDFTPSERLVADALLADYPMAGLQGMAEFAQRAEVSIPTVLRLAKKLGFDGFPGFEKALRDEVAEQLQTPISKHDKWSDSAPDEHVLNRFGQAVSTNLRTSLKLLDHREFDAIAKVLAAETKAVHIVGGRITQTIAEYLFTHLQMVRPGTHLLPATPSLWPQHILNMKKGDTLVMFDIRRYDPSILEFAKVAAGRGLVIVLFTDQWLSPASAFATHTLPLRIEVPSSWDSSVTLLFFAEALVAAVASLSWTDTRKRIADLETISDAVRRKRT